MTAGRSRHAPWVIVLAGVAAALHVGKLPPALPALQLELGISLVQAGFLLALVQMGAMTLGLVAGLLADGVGLRRCMLAGLVLMTLAGLAGAWARGASDLLWLRAIEGVGVMLATVPAPSLLRRSVAPARLTRMLGIWSTFMPLGTALALLVGPLVIALAGWRAWWVLIAACSGAMAVWVARVVPPDVRAAVARVEQPTREAWHRRLLATLRVPGPWLAALSFSVYAAQWMAVIGFLPTLYQMSGWGGALGAVLTATVAAVNMIGNIAAGRLLHRGVGAQRLLWVGFGAMALGGWLAFGSATLDAPVLRYGGALLFSTVGGLIPGTLFGLAPRVAPGEHTIATTVGWMQQWSAIGQMAGPPVVAWVASTAGSWDWTWAVTGACCVAGAALAGLIARQLARPPAGA
ncbi:MAG TPA: MFS transporter [Ottowia sp.]|uniref:MFS transporter n=1 Tax=Ottowia sp. TaxID=1898956 RepID=UPI002C2C9586|nr:MFS transporter [Ottowia sp.]HMN20332.1 MFS transporter [Ottowia sp.]